jgi:hypothetical protein
MVEIGAELTLHLGCTDADDNLDSGGAQALHALSAHHGVGIQNPDDHPSHPGIDDRVRTRRRATDVRAGFERHVQGGADGAPTGSIEDHPLGMSVPRSPRTALEGGSIIAHQNSTDPGIGGSEQAAVLGAGDRSLHQRHGRNLVVGHQ